MYKQFKISILLLLFFTFFLSFETSAQIHDIKKKSNSNKSNSSSNSSGSSSSSSSDTDDCVSGCIGSIIGDLFDGCLTAIFSGNGKNEDNNDYAGSYSGDDDLFPLVEIKKETEIINKNAELEQEKKISDLKNDSINKNIDEELVANNKQPVKNQDNNELNIKVADNKLNNNPIENNNSFERNKNYSLDINANFAIALHKGIDKMYTYVNYLPGLRANLDIFIVDFRFNILTEYTDGFPDSFTALELLFLANLTTNQDFNVILGTGLHREDISKSNFNEFYLGTKIPLNNGRDYFDADMRVSVDFATKAYPFFEIGGRYQTRIMNFGHLSGYISLGMAYQNYYQSHDIWSAQGGVLINIH